MQRLIEGLHQFQHDVFRPQREFFESLAKGQRPETLFITCSDSRINPNLLTQTGPGELFILRNAGNIVPPYGAVQGGEEATIEYAVAVLGVRDIVVCGHSHCGAMNALIQDKEPSLPAVARWLRHAEATRQIMAQSYGHLTDGPRLTAAVEENVLVQLENLRTHPVVAAGLNRKALHLHGWVYKLETGEVFAYEPGRGQFIALDTDGARAKAAAAGGDKIPLSTI
jgi:carbonic anhydrase